jgi:hypothetical protein
MFRTSSFCTGDLPCVEVDNDTPGVIRVRDSKNPTGAVLTFDDVEWDVFKKGIENGEF